MAAILRPIRGYLDDLLGLNFRQLLAQGVNLGARVPPRLPRAPGAGLRLTRGRAGLIVTSALMIWKGLILVTGSESPVGAPGHLALHACNRSQQACAPARQYQPGCRRSLGGAPCATAGAHQRSPQIVVVLSGSMEPGYWRGDILFLRMGAAPLRAGEVVVFNLKERDIPIVHRVIKVHEEGNGNIVLLTKVSPHPWTCRG